MKNKTESMTTDEQMIETGEVSTSVDETVPLEQPDAELQPEGEETEAPAAPTPEEELKRLKEEIAALEDRSLRQAAEFQNFRKRSLEERAFSVEIGRSQVALPMVDVLDDLRRSVEAADKGDTSGAPDGADAGDALRNGVKLVYEKFESELARLGIKPMEVVGQPFDEHKHEAMLQQPAPEGTEPGTILAEIQKGYTIGDRVLRHARVVVAN